MEAVHKIHTHLDLNLNELRNVRLDHHESNPEPASGRIIYNPISHEIRYSDGKKWYSISLGCWSFDEDGNIVAEGDVIIRGNLIVEGDTTSGAPGEDNPSGCIPDADLEGYAKEEWVREKFQALITQTNKLSYGLLKDTPILGTLSKINVPTEGGKFMMSTGGGDAVWVILDKNRVGLANVDNTADANKNVASATKLTTARTLWGNSFDGTQNISGNILLPKGKYLIGGAGEEGIYITDNTISWHGSNNLYSKGFIKFDGSDEYLITIFSNLKVDKSLSVTQSIFAPTLTSTGGLNITANTEGTSARLYLTTGTFRPWAADAGNIDLGMADVQWRTLYAKTTFLGKTTYIQGGETNPYIRFTLNEKNWYCQAYNDGKSDGIFLGSTSTKSLKVDADGNVYCSNNLIVTGDVTSI